MPDSSHTKRQYLAAKLAAHTASDAERDEALATILLTLWTEEDIERTIDNRHNQLCKDDCPLKHPAAAAPSAASPQNFKEKLIMELTRILGHAIIIIAGLVGVAKLFADKQ